MIQPKIQTVYVSTYKSSNLKVGTVERQFYEEFILIDTVESQELITFTPEEFETFKREFGKDLLEKAADNALVESFNHDDYSYGTTDSQYIEPNENSDYFNFGGNVRVNKESITSVLDDYLKDNKI